MLSNQDPLEELLVDASEVDRDEIARGLMGIVGIDSNSGNVVFRPRARQLTARNKIVAFLLGRKVAHLLEKSEGESAAAKSVIAGTGLPSGTVYPGLKELKELRLVSQQEDDSYYVAAHQVHDALEALQTSTSETKK